MATDLNMANNKIIHLASPTDANDVINKSYVDTQTNNLLKTDGIKPVSADLSMATKKVINLTTPTNGNDAANKSYVDGVKQAATSVFAPLYFFNCEMGHDNKKTTEFLKS